MSDSSRSVGRFDANRLTDWLLGTQELEPLHDPREWSSITAALSGDVYAALQEQRPTWHRPAEAYLRALAEAVRAEAVSAHDAAVSRMNMTAVVVRSVPSTEWGDRWRPTAMVDLFLERCPVTLAEAQRLAGAQPLPPVGDLVRLRHAKTMLNPLVLLAPFLPPDSVDRIRPWLELRERLP
ncbi:hypothetical protein Aph02nite_35230 [Actinoplanes philippinensis]|uniref:Uncharacterized protein n=1 Tax=Actinoplanes philippinensis TaxID=35752 RepID=A0A1I2F9Q8_9ACTN|nr:hypothetical protein [Actinoplanes philippinensis]GIE77573.1 hypothetical protein Aph02nite_35230 [Actinoplanes philippinensis]SFF01773.1 hypothetical protein SAMN05421541_105216 [Actinoplanes philippinensis]